MGIILFYGVRGGDSNVNIFFLSKHWSLCCFGLIVNYSSFKVMFVCQRSDYIVPQNQSMASQTMFRLLSVKPCRLKLLFIQTFLYISCASAISCTSFYKTYTICLDRLLGLCNHFCTLYSNIASCKCQVIGTTKHAALVLMLYRCIQQLNRKTLPNHQSWTQTVFI